MAFARLTDRHPLHGACITHESAWRIDCAELENLRSSAGWACQICGRTPGSGLVTDHDHTVGKYAIRGTLCMGCNGNYMGWIDSGRCPIEPVALAYISNPWYLASKGMRLAYNPMVSVRVCDLSETDRAELDRLHRPGTSIFISWIQDRQPKFEHEAIAACVAVGDLRSVARLIRMVHIWKLPDLDITEVGPHVPGGCGAPHLGGSIQEPWLRRGALEW